MPENSNPQIIGLQDKVSPIILASIFGCNISLIYQEQQAGRLPANLLESTYIEAIQHYIRYFKKATELKILKETNEQELRLQKLKQDKQIQEEKLATKLEQEKLLAEKKAERRRPTFSGEEGEDSIHPLVAAKMKQNIKTEIAREEQIWQKIAIERKDYISSEEMVELCEPFIMSIRDIFLSIGQMSPELEKKVDESMENLFNLGTQLIVDAELDSKEFVKSMLAKEIEM
jgi:hypothetical protein